MDRTLESRALALAASLFAALFGPSLVVACGAAAPTAGQLPGPLHEFRLVEDHPQIPPAVFPHAAHVGVDAGHGAVTCVDCHHELKDAPTAVPQPCRACHQYAYLAVEVDESKPHVHGPPDL